MYYPKWVWFSYSSQIQAFQFNLRASLWQLSHNFQILWFSLVVVQARCGNFVKLANRLGRQFASTSKIFLMKLSCWVFQIDFPLPCCPHVRHVLTFPPSLCRQQKLARKTACCDKGPGTPIRRLVPILLQPEISQFFLSQESPANDSAEVALQWYNWIINHVLFVMCSSCFR